VRIFGLWRSSDNTNRKFEENKNMYIENISQVMFCDLDFSGQLLFGDRANTTKVNLSTPLVDRGKLEKKLWQIFS
jgi:hypothetical protein